VDLNLFESLCSIVHFTPFFCGGVIGVIAILSSGVGFIDVDGVINVDEFKFGCVDESCCLNESAGCVDESDCVDDVDDDIVETKDEFINGVVIESDNIDTGDVFDGVVVDGVIVEFFDGID
jgi:hypothetical protein